MFDQWYQRFEKEPSLAVGDLLGGRVHLGVLNQAEPSEALFHAMSGLGRQRLDGALLEWLKQVMAADNAASLGYSNPKAFSRMLVQSFHAASSMNLHQTLKWMGGDKVQGGIRAFLAEYFYGRSRDPLGAYYAALACHQEDQGLLRLWLDVIALSGYGFTHYGCIGLDGLLRMPDDSGPGPAGRISESLLVGLLHFARGLSRMNREKAELDRYVDFLKSAYPMSHDAWTRKLTQAHHRVPLDDTAKQWLEGHFPQAFAEHAGTRDTQQLPSETERKAMLQRLKREPLADLRTELTHFLDRYRRYTKNTGDSYFLVRTFNSFGSTILHKNPVLAVELAQEAATWEPYDAHSWSLLGRALDEAGDWRWAQALFWQARRRFPHNAVSHNQLGDALARRGETEAALAVLEESIRFFPDDHVPRVSKAYALLWAEKPEEALIVLNETVRVFPKEVYGYRAKADALMRLGRLEDAGKALEQARVIDPHDPELLKKESVLRKFQAGKVHDPYLQPRPTGHDSSPDTLAEITGRDFSHAPSLGRATAFRRQGEHGKAKANLEQINHPSEKRSEMGLLIWNEKGPAEASDYFDAQLKEHPGDGALKLHYSRACQRSNRESVDWDHLKMRFPEMEAVILTEKNNGKPPRYPIPSDSEERTMSHEDHKRGWFRTTLDRDDSLLDPMEEEMVASQMA